MSLYKITSSQLSTWVNNLVQDQKVYGPVAKRDKFVYSELADASPLRLDFDVTLHSPKNFFLPAQEPLVRYNTQGEYESVIETEPFVLFGVHPYDVVAISQMDYIFQKDHVDVHYMKRRENATIVACDVYQPSENVFASCMGTATVQEGFDVLLTIVDAEYVIDVRTEKGGELVQQLEGAEEADDIVKARREQVWENAQRFLCQHKLKCSPEELPELLEEAYEHPVWEKRSQRCYSCGSCNLVCPTCYCFDVQDDVNYDLQSGERRRQWDGCLLQNFALVAGDHNFRGDRAARYRHRYYRKGKYLYDRMGLIACVGCGRCISACTSNIANPVEIYNTIWEDLR